MSVVTVGQEIRGVFDLLDENKDGYIHVDDVRNVLSTTCNIYLWRREVKRMLKLADADRDGKVSLQDFLHLYISLMGISVDSIKTCDKQLWSQYMEYLGQLDVIIEQTKFEMGKEDSKRVVESGEKPKPQQNKNLEEEKQRREIDLEEIRKEKIIEKEKEDLAEKERIRAQEVMKQREIQMEVDRAREETDRLKKEEDRMRAELERLRREQERLEKEKLALEEKRRQEEVERQRIRQQEALAMEEQQKRLLALEADKERARKEKEAIDREEAQRLRQEAEREQLRKEKEAAIRLEQEKKKREMPEIDVKKSQVIGSAWSCMVIGLDYTIKFYPVSSSDQPVKVNDLSFRISTMADDDDDEGGVIDTLKPVELKNNAYIFKYSATDKLTHIWYTFDILQGENIVAQSLNVLIGPKKKLTTEIDKLGKKIQQLHVKQNDSGALGMETSLGGQISKLQTKVDAYKALLSEIGE
jgi:hypothetical protein